MIAIILTIYSFIPQTELKAPEQIAFDYFIENTFDVKYVDNGKAFFSGLSESKASISGPFQDCFKSDDSFKDFFYNEKAESVSQQRIDFTETKRFRKSCKVKKKGLNVEVYRAVDRDGFAYVYLKVYKMQHFVDHYLYKVSLSDLEVVDTCSQSEII